MGRFDYKQLIMKSEPNTLYCKRNGKVNIKFDNFNRELSTFHEISLNTNFSWSLKVNKCQIITLISISANSLNINSDAGVE